MLLVDHTFVYTGAIRKMRRDRARGDMGQLYYYDSIRVNLGLFQRDVNVISDLAVHDFAILDYLLAEQPVAVIGGRVRTTFRVRPENLAYVTLFYNSGTIAHANVSWLAPVKVRQILIGGSKKMITYDDLEPSEKVKIYDKGVSFTDDPNQIYEMRVGYRMGDMWAPKLDVRSPAASRAEHFTRCIEENDSPMTDGTSGLRVVELIEAATSSMHGRGETVDLPAESCLMIPFVDLKAQYRAHQARARRRPSQAVLDSCQFIARQRKSRRFEDEFATYCGDTIGCRREHRHERAASGASGGRHRPGR